jgi:phospholipid/cholesterol/gamma-HCH transport system permease protein
VTAFRFELADTTLRLEGTLRRAVVGELAAVLARQPAGARWTLDLSAVEAMDSAAVAAVVHAWRAARTQGGALAVGAASEPARRALALFRPGPDEKPPPPPPGALESMGGGLLGAGDSARDLLQLAADATFAVAGALRRPRTMRWGALGDQCIYIGSQALPIVGLISFLVGLTVAFQAAYQLQQFGAAIYVANLAGVSMVREMGPLMTAILVAGRSGSSIAAEIATMQVSEEVDALRVMGMDPIGFLAVPRLLAIALMVPLLTVLGDVLGILGGFVVGIFYLDIAWNAFLHQMLESLVPWDMVSGLIKSVAFAWGIGLIGLFYGFRVKGGAGEVGRTTTSSVVASIFYIIVADCVFSVVFYVLL